MLDHVILHGVSAAPLPQDVPLTLEVDVGRGLGLVLLYEVRLNRWRMFSPGDFDQLRQRLIGADRISGLDLLAHLLPALYTKSSLRFRMLPLFRQLGGKSSDLFWMAAQALGREAFSPEFRANWSLDSVARATLDRSRVGTGEEAAIHLSRGEWASAASYALDDGALTLELCLFAEKHGYLVAPSGQRLNLRQRMTWNPLRNADPLNLVASSPDGELPQMQKPASMEELIKSCEITIAKAEEVLK